MKLTLTKSQMIVNDFLLICFFRLTLEWDEVSMPHSAVDELRREPMASEKVSIAWSLP